MYLVLAISEDFNLTPQMCYLQSPLFHQISSSFNYCRNFAWIIPKPNSSNFYILFINQSPIYAIHEYTWCVLSFSIDKTQLSSLFPLLIIGFSKSSLVPKSLTKIVLKICKHIS